MHVVVRPVEKPPSDGIEVTPEMIWAALEEWAAFDEGRDELGAFVARLYRAMEAARRDAGAVTRRGWPPPG